MGSGCGDTALVLRATDRVKYPSLVCSEDSDGVGDGEMTRGVAGIGYEYDIAAVRFKWPGVEVENQVGVNIVMCVPSTCFKSCCGSDGAD